MAVNPFANMDGSLESEVRKFTLIFVIACAIIYSAFRISGIPSEVGTLYYGYADAMLDGRMPYSGFPAEYPPFAMLLILIPGLFSFSSFSYQIAFGVMVYLFLLAGLVCVHRIAETYSERPSVYTDVYIVLCVCILELILDRYDIFPVIMCLAALYFIRMDRMNLAWVMIALGTITKLYPALMAPVLLMYLCRRRRYRGALKGIGICLVIGCSSMLPFLIADPGTMFMFLTYHMDRGMQVESLVSSAMMLLGDLNIIDIGYVFDHGSDNIYGAVPDAVAGCMLYLMAATLLITYVAYWHISEKISEEYSYQVLTAVCLAAVMIFMLVNKVLSSQYIIWMIPFITVLAMSMKPAWKRMSICAFVVSIALTQINLIVNYAMRGAGEPLSTFGISVVLIRNLLLSTMLVLLFRAVLRPGDVFSDGEI